jgi:hypothetical protein
VHGPSLLEFSPPSQPASWSVLVNIPVVVPVGTCFLLALDYYDVLCSTEKVLGHACERKEIIDLVNSLNATNKSTGLLRAVYQKLKMNNSGVENKFYVAQGAVKDMYKTHMQCNFLMARRVHEYIKTMEEENYTVTFFAQDAATQVVDFLQSVNTSVLYCR